MNQIRGSTCLPPAMLALLLTVPPGPLPAGEGAAEEKPERLVTLAVEYPGIAMPRDEDITMDLIFRNEGKRGEDVDVEVAARPEGWTTEIKTYQFTVTSLHIPAGEKKTVDFEADPGDEVEPGEYEFRIAARTRDGEFELEKTIKVKLLAEEEEVVREEEDLTLSTSYPVLEGPSDGEFAFSVDVESDLDEDTVVNLAYEAPGGWTIRFKPGYESKYITSLRIRANGSSSIDVEVEPPPGAQAGEHDILVRASAAGAKAEIPLRIVLTGKYDMRLGTAMQGFRPGPLSLEASQGKPKTVSLIVQNIGSAPLHGVTFTTRLKPDGWDVTLDPEEIPSIEPGGVEQVEAEITPAEDALVGDWMVNIGASSRGAKPATDSLELRVTVKASSAWGWIGIGIIVIVVGGLTGLFRWLGRR